MGLYLEGLIIGRIFASQGLFLGVFFVGVGGGRGISIGILKINIIYHEV